MRASGEARREPASGKRSVPERGAESGSRCRHHPPPLMVSSAIARPTTERDHGDRRRALAEREHAIKGANTIADRPSSQPTSLYGRSSRAVATTARRTTIVTDQESRRVIRRPSARMSAERSAHACVGSHHCQAATGDRQKRPRRPGETGATTGSQTRPERRGASAAGERRKSRQQEDALGPRVSSGTEFSPKVRRLLSQAARAPALKR